MKVPKELSMIRRMRDARLRELGSVRPFVAASLVETAVRCGKPSCRCASGERHSAFVLTYKQHAKTRTVYVPKNSLEEVRAWTTEHRRVKTLLAEISTLSLALLAGQARVRRERRTPPQI